MKTTIDNNQRVFLINRKGFFTRSYFCNLHQIPNIIKKQLDKNDEYTISEYWNFKFKRISKKALNQMFYAAEINYSI